MRGRDTLPIQRRVQLLLMVTILANRFRSPTRFEAAAGWGAVAIRGTAAV